jgi:hypothetical protein
MKARRTWKNVIQTLRELKCQPRLLYPAKLSITLDGEINVFHKKKKKKKKKNNTLSFHEPSPSKDNNRKKKIQGWTPHPRKSKKVILQQT